MKKIFATIILSIMLLPQLAMADDSAKGGSAATNPPVKTTPAPEKPKAAETPPQSEKTTTPPDSGSDTETIPTAPTSGSSQKFDLNALRIEQGSGSNGISQGTSFFNRKDANGDPVSPITAFILTAIEFLTKIIGSVAFLILIVSGIWMIVTVGNETQVNKAKDMILYAIIGIAVAFGSYLIVTFVQGLLIQ